MRCCKSVLEVGATMLLLIASVAEEFVAIFRAERWCFAS